MSNVTRIRLHGKKLICTGTKDKPQGAIATEEQYRNNLRSYAHLYADGTISRFGEKIGCREDIEWGEPVEIVPTDDAILHLLRGEFSGVDDTVDIA